MHTLKRRGARGAKWRMAIVLVALASTTSACGGTPVEGGSSPSLLPSAAPTKSVKMTSAPTAAAEPLEDARFWDIIDGSLDASDGTVEGQIVALEEILAQLSPAEIASFDETFATKKSDLYSWDLWGAAYVLNGGCSDDCFDYFRTWIVGQGRDYYDAVRQEPQTLGGGAASVSADSFDAELLAYVGADAYERASGGRDLFTDYPTSPSAGDAEEPSGEEWDEEEVDSLYPELTTLP